MKIECVSSNRNERETVSYRKYNKIRMIFDIDDVFRV
jgi:hypothetical protein